MSLTLEPLADNADPWVIALERLEAKILDTNLSFYKVCVTKFGRGPRVYAHKGAGPEAEVYDPDVDKCPAVVLETTNPGQMEDHGAGAERWPFTVMLYFKAFAKDGDQRVILRAFHELIRTVFVGWRTGTMDPLSTIPGGTGYGPMPGDLTPEISRPSTGLLCGRGAFAVRFSFTENILG
jgi:hypothetical protein